MALYHKWDVKNGFAYVLQFFSLISDGLGGVGFTHSVYINIVPHKALASVLISKNLAELAAEGS